MHLVVVPPTPEPPVRPTAVSCPACSDHFGFRVFARVTIRPTTALRMASGSMVIDNPTVICATCAERGVETVL